MSAPDPELDAFLVEAGLASPGAKTRWMPLAGGVSSDIWHVDADGRQFCVKRALAKLKVAAHWTAPVERNGAEWDFLQVADAIAPGHVPRPIARDPVRGLFAMAWLTPQVYRLWKAELLAGRAEPDTAASVGDLLGRLHAATACDPSIPERFAFSDTFHALRVDAYLLATARVHTDLTREFEAIAERTFITRRVLVHGDVSPKNILIGPEGPVLLDAECAWFGDPAFDLAFCLNHLVIKQRIVAGATVALAACFDRLTEAYLDRVDWEPRRGIEERAATLLPALALARVDGKSPLEYLNSAQRGSLSTAARRAMVEQPTRLQTAKSLLGV